MLLMNHRMMGKGNEAGGGSGCGRLVGSGAASTNCKPCTSHTYCSCPQPPPLSCSSGGEAAAAPPAVPLLEQQPAQQQLQREGSKNLEWATQVGVKDMCCMVEQPPTAWYLASAHDGRRMVEFPP